MRPCPSRTRDARRHKRAHRVAISNHRLVSFHDDQVTFRFRDSAHHNKKRLLTLPADEFLRRFLLHVLPRGFVRIRHYGYLARRRRGELVSLSQQLLAAAALVSTPARIPTSFRVWAKFATSVAVAGEFNMWSAAATPLFSEGGGYWSVDVPGAGAGQNYKFVLVSPATPNPLWRMDPYAGQIAHMQVTISTE